MDLGLWWEDGRELADLWRGVEVLEPMGASRCKMASLALMTCSDVLDDVRRAIHSLPPSCLCTEKGAAPS